MTNRLTTEEAAKRIGVAKNTLEHWRADGKGPEYMKGQGRVTYSEESLHDWVNAKPRLVNAILGGELPGVKTAFYGATTIGIMEHDKNDDNNGKEYTLAIETQQDMTDVIFDRENNRLAFTVQGSWEVMMFDWIIDLINKEEAEQNARS